MTGIGNTLSCLPGKGRIFVASLALLYLTGCGTAALTTTIDSTRAESYQGTPEILFVIIRSHESSDALYSTFESTFKPASASCGVTADIYHLYQTKEQNGAAAAISAAKKSGADTILQILPAGGIRSGVRLKEIGFKATLRDATEKTHKKIWLADIVVTPAPTGIVSWEAMGTTLGEALIDRLEVDSIFRHCAKEKGVDAEISPEM